VFNKSIIDNNSFIISKRYGVKAAKGFEVKVRVRVTVHFVLLQLVLILFECVGMGVGEGESEGGEDELKGDGL
jgi:hypothetical protein